MMSYFNTWQYGPGMMFSLAPVMGVLWLLCVVAWFWVLIDAAKRTFVNKYEKALWILALLITPMLAIVAYLVIFKAAKNTTGILPPSTP